MNAVLARHADRITDEMAALLLVGEAPLPLYDLDQIEARYETLADQLDWIEAGRTVQEEVTA